MAMTRVQLNQAFREVAAMEFVDIPCEEAQIAFRFSESFRKKMEKLITRKEAAKILGISIATLDEARNNGLISYIQYVPNGCVYFTDAALQEYIAKSTHRAKPMEKRSTYRNVRRG